MKSKFLIYALLITVIAIFTSCEKDDAISVESQACSNMLYFDSEEELVAEMNNVAKMTLGEKVQWEKSKGFNSIEIAAEKLYKSINPDNFKSKEEVVSFVEKNSSYLKLTEDDKGEYELNTRLSGVPLRYFVNEQSVFQVKDLIYKVFNEGVVSVNEEQYLELINSDFETALTLTNSSNVLNKEQSLKSIINSCTGTTKRTDVGNERIRLVFTPYDGEVLIGFDYEIRAYHQYLGVWFRAKRTLSCDLQATFTSKGNPTTLRYVNEGETDYVLYGAKILCLPCNECYVTYDCWAKQACTGQATAICY